MYESRTIAVVIPCFNEQDNIVNVLTKIPDFVDAVVIVDDASTDDTARIVDQQIAREGDSCRTVLLRREQNGGPGAAVITGLTECLRRDYDITAVMDGDGQMNAQELPWLIGPVAQGQADYAKGNRLFYRGAWQRIPHSRYLGNAFLSMLTKIASGYWHVADSQSGYLAISREVLETIDLQKIDTGYGYTNDLLVHLNVYDFRVADVHVRPIYWPQRQSKMKAWIVFPRLNWMVFKRFWWRMWRKYVIHDFHPLVLFYFAATLSGLAATGLFVRLVWLWIATGSIPRVNALVWVLCTLSAIQLGLFAMWCDMEANRDLKCVPRRRLGRSR
ncbi:hypothetical protein LCGC14_0274830 [marine sediment metagenome]|uniref:Glycosyltransferase 2-like domain-containing protein n=1 Tax=marine sediment metagenome TaxID=412755 RepID=A0A0F9TXX2_9ZZZZ